MLNREKILTVRKRCRILPGLGERCGKKFPGTIGRLVYAGVVILVSLFFQSFTKGISSGKYSLMSEKGRCGYGIVISDGTDIVSSQESPAIVSIKGSSDLTCASKTYTSGYSSVRKSGDKLIAKAKVTTPNGSVFSIRDTYSVLSDNSFSIDRNVNVIKCAAGDNGFSTRISIPINQGSGEIDGYEYFIPSILYKNTKFVRRNAVGANLDGGKMYVKETRCGMPLAMTRDISSGLTVTLLHHNPKIDVGENPGGGVPGEINNDLQYGSIGYGLDSISIDYTYPCLEGPRTYEPRKPSNLRNNPGEIWYGRYHKISKGSGHKYRVALILNKTCSYTDAMTDSFREAYSLENPIVCKMSIEDIYKDNLILFKDEYTSFGTGGLISAGLPWSLALPDGKNTQGVSFQMGFVGQQIACGYHLYRYGKDYNDSDAVAKGKSIIDFWTSDPIMSACFPIVWWDPVNNDTAGQARGYPSFLRCFVDGMEGLLDACRISEAYNDRQDRWEWALDKVASNLVEKQNEDGSFYRAYSVTGEVAEELDRNTQAGSKLNTPIAVRFLVKMYEHTGENKYKEAAIKAGEYSYNEIFLKEGKYVGGTPDNPNTVDKEAAIFAMYAFNAIHELTGDPKYLKAAEHAGISTMSWAYCYDFAIPNKDESDASRNPFSNGGTLGYSLIATGHSGADNFIAYTFYEIYKLYIKTGDEIYLNMARFLEHNTKLSTDYSGKMGYRYKAFMPEATNIADLAFRSVSFWLPWCSIANIEPIVQLEEAFGVKDIDDITASLPELREKLYSYGVGGKPIRR